MSLALLTAMVQEFIQDAPELDPDKHIKSCIDEALTEYSKEFPRYAVTDFDGNGSAAEFDLPASWDEAFSTIVKVEYPVESQQDNRMNAGNYRLVQTPEGNKLELLYDTPSTGEQVRLTITAAHTLSDDSTTVPANHFKALAHLAAAKAFDMLEAAYAQKTDSAFGSDISSNVARATLFQQLSRKHETHFRRLLGLSTKTDSVTPESMQVNLNVEPDETMLLPRHRPSWR